MHELSLCLSILKIIEKQMDKTKFSSVKTIWLEIGKFAAVEKDAMLFSFKVASKNTIAENANLIFIDVEGYSVQIQRMEVS